MTIPTQCRWCEHDDYQHEIGPDFEHDGGVCFPCIIVGCDCEDYEQDTDLELESR